MTQSEGGSQRASGHIKWFDPVKGFGFILDDRGGPDILLHANVLRSFGQNSIADGSRVEVEVTPTPRGLQASSILSLSPPTPEDNARPLAELALGIVADLEELPFVPARVKWFDKAKGFGFATVFGQAADVFLHYEVLRHGGFADLATGEAVALRVLRGSRGLMAVQVASWDRGFATVRTSPDAGPAESGGSREGQGPQGNETPGPQDGGRRESLGKGIAAVPDAPPPNPIGAGAVAAPPLVAAEHS